MKFFGLDQQCRPRGNFQYDVSGISISTQRRSNMELGYGLSVWASSVLRACVDKLRCTSK
eukprot:9611818-Prorocentrum_lima.AAC.1